MTGRAVGTTKGTTISVRRKLYEKIFSIVSEINFKCGFIDGKCLQQSDVFECLTVKFTPKLMGLTENGFTSHLQNRIDSEGKKTTIYINGRTLVALDRVTQAINLILKPPSSFITRTDVLEVLILHCADDVRDYYLTQYREKCFCDEKKGDL
ncbi:hypothetical protein ACFPSD_003453 [Salmonella enterica]|uniref:Uncharacterized protein n=1 Tax=Salmonella enterica TaxID=28901 RepID=A0A8E6QX21_SALER|nr:hypothetical protein [Salmonella enterica]EDD4260962.1 hypothetical protein [Salmonella enterica subsp. enterica serovar Newport]EBP0982894.1 hypothetical protein [Salmonella enterica]ECG9374861.1 hypothetical protein [Salmonella enterica]EDJ6698939.1 hypothetical protein [Salmonella enterica subsp. enterica serovar Newport]